MNWLAHVFLSAPGIEVRMGNLLADLVKGRDRLSMSAAFLRGVQQHQAVDAFTDAHPIVHRSRARLSGRYRYVKGILIDIFYDHFLAIYWERYSSESLDAFTAELYADLRSHVDILPKPIQGSVNRILGEDLLGSYRHLVGVETSLRRVSQRLSARVGRDFALETGVAELRVHYDALAEDFAEFFPLLQAYASEIQGETKEPEA